MKKLLLFAFSLLLVTSLSASPVLDLLSGSSYMIGTDTLELYDTSGVKINNSTIKVFSSNPDVDALVGYIWLKNTTTTEMPNVFVKRIINQEVDGTTNSFCFGINCYPPWIGESAVADTAKVGIINKSFYADYYPEKHGGLTSITYEFFDNVTFGTRVSASATIEFHISANSIAEEKLVFKGPYPNPASQFTNFEYNIPASYNNAQLIIRNMLGVEVDNISFSERSGKQAINVSNWASGIYFYSVVVDGKVIQTKKFVVKH